jgi:hypothetical protein
VIRTWLKARRDGSDSWQALTGIGLALRSKSLACDPVEIRQAVHEATSSDFNMEPPRRANALPRLKEQLAIICLGHAEL